MIRFVLLVSLLSLAEPAPPPAADPPPRPVLFVPPRADSSGAPESEPAPLIIPGRSPGPEAPATPQQRAADWAARGAAMEASGALLPAAAAYRNAIAADHELKGIAIRLGDIYTKLGDHDAASRAYAIEVSRDPGNLDAGRNLGLALARSGQSAAAIQELELLTRRAPAEEDLWRALGFACVGADSLAKAEHAFRRALALGRERASERRDLGALLSSLGRHAEARTQMNRAIQLAPKDAGNWLNLGNLERRAGKLDAALAAYRKAEACDSSLALARRAQAQALVDLGRTREAGAAYRRWLERDPADLAGRLEVFEHFIAEGRADAALEIARDAVRTDDRSPDVRLMYGLALAATGDRRGALTEMRSAQSVEPDAGKRGRIESLVASLRASAPDSLRALFAEDSVRAVRDEAQREAAAREKRAAPEPRGGRR